MTGFSVIILNRKPNLCLAAGWMKHCQAQQWLVEKDELVFCLQNPDTKS